MHTTRLRKVDGSVMLVIPLSILDLLNFEAGSLVGMSVNGNKLVIKLQRKRKYTLQELAGSV